MSWLPVALVTLLAAGHETTATALAWCLERLARHPADLREDPDPFIEEVLRTRPVLSITARKTLQPAVSVTPPAALRTFPIDQPKVVDEALTDYLRENDDAADDEISRWALAHGSAAEIAR